MDPKRPKLTTNVKKEILLNTKQDTGRLGPMYTVRQCFITQSKIQQENETENYVNIELRKQNT